MKKRAGSWSARTASAWRGRRQSADTSAIAAATRSCGRWSVGSTLSGGLACLRDKGKCTAAAAVRPGSREGGRVSPPTPCTPTHRAPNVVARPHDAEGNGLLRRVVYPMPLGRRGESFELVKNVRANQGYDYVMLRTGLSGSMTLEPLGPNRTRLRFRETFHMTKPWLRWLEGPIYRFINKKNEESMRGAAAWLSAHLEFRPDLIDPP